jgi:uncharacterized protein YdeI (YjbR/CyaY-like superfamily)
MAKQNLNPQVDVYLDNAATFAIPILLHLRALVHKACPEVEETMKWSRPFFLYQGTIMANISAFKEHCTFGFWGQEMSDALTKAGALKDDAAGSFGRIATKKDLPSDKVMLDLIRHAAKLIGTGQSTSIIAGRPARKAVKPPLKVPAEFAAALKKDKKAASIFDAFSPSCQHEYVEWIADAKRIETRDKRIATAVEWIAEGKQRHWKYGA